MGQIFQRRYLPVRVRYQPPTEHRRLEQGHERLVTNASLRKNKDLPYFINVCAFGSMARLLSRILFDFPHRCSVYVRFQNRKETRTKLFHGQQRIQAALRYYNIRCDAFRVGLRDFSVRFVGVLAQHRAVQSNVLVFAPGCYPHDGLRAEIRSRELPERYQRQKQRHRYGSPASQLCWT